MAGARVRLAHFVGRPAVAPAVIHVVDTNSRWLAIRIHAAGRRATQAEAPIIQDLRLRRGDPPRTLEPNGPRDGFKYWYLFDITGVEMTLERVLPLENPTVTNSYKHVADGYTPLDMAALRGFAALRPSLPDGRANM